MKHNPSHSYAPIDVEELLLIGGNAVYSDGLFLFDNLDHYKNDALSESLNVRMLVKPKLDILVMSIDGELNYILDSSKTIRLKKGEMAFFHQDQIVELAEAVMDATIIMLAFPHELAIGIKGMDSIGISYDSVILRPSEGTFMTLREIYGLIRKALKDAGSVYRKDIVQMYARIILMSLSSIVDEATAKTTTASGFSNLRRETQIYNQFTRLVKESYLKSRSVGYIAEKLCVSPEHLSRIVKTVSGKTASEWIRDYVVLEAKVLLKSTDMSIYQISEALNFPNPSFFTKFFRKSTGKTPGAYRQTQ